MKDRNRQDQMERNNQRNQNEISREGYQGSKKNRPDESSETGRSHREGSRKQSDEGHELNRAL